MRWLGAALVLIGVTLLLRSTALSALSARGLVLDVLAFAAVYWALRHGEGAGTLFGFVLGLAADLDAAHWPGRHALALCLLGYAVGRLSHTLVREQARTQFTLLFIATLVHQAWALAFEAGSWAGVPPLIARALLAAPVTAAAGALFLAMVRRLGGQPVFGHGDPRTRP